MADFLTREGNDVGALIELVREGALSWAEAVNQFRSEHHVSLRYCIDIGLVRGVQQVDKAWQLHIRQGNPKL